MLRKSDKIEIMERLKAHYPDAAAELNYTTPFELLVAVVLSAQCTDVRVNIVTAELFKTIKTPHDLVHMGYESFAAAIKTCGLYQSKAKNLVATSQKLIEMYGGQVPQTLEELMTLPGVGRKSANVIISNAFNVPAIAVDTHVFRVSNRMGLVKAKTVEETEIQLMKWMPRQEWTFMHHVLIFHGRRTCNARSPKCASCPIIDKCPSYGLFK